jgi:hypothetical protein
MQSSAVAEQPVLQAAPRSGSIFGFWPYLFVLGVYGLCIYSFFRLMEAPAYEVVATAGYSAIAYSPSTGAYGSASDCATLADAEKLAISRCNAKDARTVVWAHKDAWCALAIADDHKFGIAWGNNQNDVKQAALAHCREHTQSPCHVAVVVGAQGTLNGPPRKNYGAFGAIAYSRSTGQFGTSRGCATLAEAERIALSGCNAADAEIVTWNDGAWIALAVARDRAFGYAWGNTADEARTLALEHCKAYASGTPYQIKAVVDTK